MGRTAKRFLTPGWVGFTLFAAAAAVTMVLLGRWQLRVSNTKHFDLQNFGYALQWWAFSAFAVLIWARAVRDTWRRPGSTGASTGGELVLRSGQSAGVAYAGPADLVTKPAHPGQAPVVYRGYVMPQSATSPDRSDGDRLRASYNDYLWQLSLADAERPDRSRRSSVEPRPVDGGPVPAHSPDAVGPSKPRAIDAVPDGSGDLPA